MRAGSRFLMTGLMNQERGQAGIAGAPELLEGSLGAAKPLVSR